METRKRALAQKLRAAAKRKQNMINCTGWVDGKCSHLGPNMPGTGKVCERGEHGSDAATRKLPCHSSVNEKWICQMVDGCPYASHRNNTPE
jgi:hypothetical protein